MILGETILYLRCGHKARNVKGYWEPEEDEVRRQSLPQGLQKECTLLTPQRQASGLQNKFILFKATQFVKIHYGNLKEPVNNTKSKNFKNGFEENRKAHLTYFIFPESWEYLGLKRN